MIAFIVAGLQVLSPSSSSAQPPLPPLTIEVVGRPGTKVECTAVTLSVRERFPQRERTAVLQIELSFRLPEREGAVLAIDKPLVRRAVDQEGKELRLLGANVRPPGRRRGVAVLRGAPGEAIGDHPRPRPPGGAIAAQGAGLSAATEFSLPLPLPLPDELSLLEVQVPLRTPGVNGATGSTATALKVRLRHVPVPRID